MAIGHMIIGAGIFGGVFGLILGAMRNPLWMPTCAVANILSIIGICVVRHV